MFALVSLFGFFHPHRFLVFLCLLMCVSVVCYGSYSYSKRESMLVEDSGMIPLVVITSIWILFGGFAFHKIPKRTQEQREYNTMM